MITAREVYKNDDDILFDETMPALLYDELPMLVADASFHRKG